MTGGAPSDDDLVRMSRSGDKTAFPELYRRHKQKIMNFAFRMTGDRETSADVVQETFEYLFRKIPDYRFEAKLATLLFRAARSICLNAIEKRRRMPSPMDDGSEPVYMGDPACEAERSDLAASAFGALGRLPDLYREAVALRIIEGLGCAEIASILGCPEGTVKSRVHNGLELLRKALTRREPAGDSTA